jgi:RsiW-degrading membrane proteinase PrsW (M82 family)
MTRFYYEHEHLGRLGPCSLDELRQLADVSIIRPETLLVPEGGGPPISWAELVARVSAPGDWEHQGSPASPLLPPPLPPLGTANSFTRRAGEDLRMLLPHLLLPLQEIRTFRWMDNQRALAIAGIGLLPLLIYAMFGGGSQLGNAFWAMALYFSALWALFFYAVFPTPEARLAPASFCFFSTGLLSIGVLLHLYRLWPLSSLLLWTQRDQSLLVQWMGFVLGVGLPEELCKALVVVFLVVRFGPFAPKSVLFYGLMAGLGFGIYEGVSYQTSHNFRFAVDMSGPQNSAIFAAEYYFLNLIRLTTLPFLHAIWSGMAGYFIGFAAQYPERRRGLFIVAIGVPALLHGSYNAFSASALGLALALLSVLALNLYLAKSVEFERLLARR